MSTKKFGNNCETKPCLTYLRKQKKFTLRKWIADLYGSNLRAAVYVKKGLSNLIKANFLLSL